MITVIVSKLLLLKWLAIQTHIESMGCSMFSKQVYKTHGRPWFGLVWWGRNMSRSDWSPDSCQIYKSNVLCHSSFSPLLVCCLWTYYKDMLCLQFPYFMCNSQTIKCNDGVMCPSDVINISTCFQWTWINFTRSTLQTFQYCWKPCNWKPDYNIWSRSNGH